MFWPANGILFKAHLDQSRMRNKHVLETTWVLFVQYGRSDEQKKEGECWSTFRRNKISL